MSEIFRGWRRKSGLATLILALAFMGGWVRGLGLQDAIVIPFGTNKFSVVSSGPLLYLSREYDCDAGKTKALPNWKTADPSAPSLLHQAIFWNSIFWKWKWQGFGYYDCSLDDIGYRLTLFSFPYKLIAVPFTLLSAYFLLSKPRKAKPVVANQP